MKRLCCFLVAAVLSGCATQAARPAKTSAPAPAPATTIAPAASFYPSTYQPPPSAPTLIRNATVLTGTGTRLEHADVLLVDGKISAVGTALTAPANATRRRRHRPLGDPRPHRHPLAPRRVPDAGGGRQRRRQRGHLAQHRQRVGRALGVAAGSGLPHRARRRHHDAADPARLGQPHRRPLGGAEERAERHLPGHEIPRRAAGTEDGLRRESQARLRRRQEGVPVDPHGQHGRLPRAVGRGAGIPARQPRVPEEARRRRQGRQGRRSATCASIRWPPRCRARSSSTCTATAPTRWPPCSTCRRSSATTSPPSTTRSRPTRSRTSWRRTACARPCGPTGGASRWSPTTASRRTWPSWTPPRAAAPSCIRTRTRASSG